MWINLNYTQGKNKIGEQLKYYMILVLSTDVERIPEEIETVD